MQRVNKSQRVSAYSGANPPAIHVGMGETFVMETNDRFQGYTSPDDAPLDLLMSMTGPLYVGPWLDCGHSRTRDVKESCR